jgi:hypothetical protein
MGVSGTDLVRPLPSERVHVRQSPAFFAPTDGSARNSTSEIRFQYCTLCQGLLIHI